MSPDEFERNLNPEILRSQIEEKVEELLKLEQSLNGSRYGGFDLQPSVVAEWKDRPVIDETLEPLQIKDDVRVILVNKKSGMEKGPDYKSVQLHIAPVGEQPRVTHVYILNLTEGRLPDLTTYVNRFVPGKFLKEPAPMAPFGMETTKAIASTLEAFNKILNQVKPIIGSTTP